MSKHKNAIAKAKKILKEFNIRSRFSLSSDECTAFISEGYVKIGLNSPEFVDEASVLSAVFHEIAHIVNYRNRKYFTYHNDKVMNQKTLDYAIRFGLKAEQHTDYIAAKMMKERFPCLKFRYTYNRAEMKRRYKSEFLPLLASALS